MTQALAIVDGPLPRADTGEILNLLADWAPDERDRRRILIESPEALFFVD
jgi:hypothetical protein